MSRKHRLWLTNVSVLAHLVLGCIFINSYTYLKKIAFPAVAPRVVPTAACELLIEWNAILWGVPVVFFVLSFVLMKRKSWGAVIAVNHAVLAFMVLCVLLTILIWTLQEIPSVGLRGYK